MERNFHCDMEDDIIDMASGHTPPVIVSFVGIFLLDNTDGSCDLGLLHPEVKEEVDDHVPQLPLV